MATMIRIICMFIFQLYAVDAGQGQGQGSGKDSGLPDFCLKPLNTDDCNLPQKQVYFYDKQLSSCKAGVWRGCATDNMFETEPQCNQFCVDVKKRDAGIPDFCLKSLNMDDCNLPEKRVYFYDKQISACKAGAWRGCATDNMFDTEPQCTQFCADMKKSEGLPDFCLKPLKTDDCKLPQKQVYFYDKQLSACKAGVWRGCATDNMFETEPQCNQFCVDIKKSEGLPDFCLKPLNSDDCKIPQKEVYFYDKQMSTCKAGVWRGCATDNMFETESQCNQFCVDLKKNEGLPDFCLKPLNIDDCDLPQKQVYFYDQQLSACKAGVWRGCATDNMFETESQCSQFCAKTNEAEESELV